LDDALEKIKSHHRTEHPTKALYSNRVLEALETLNLTLDEAVGNYAGPNWREKLAEGRLENRAITRACQNLCTYPWQYREGLIREAQTLSLEHGVEIPDPYLTNPEPLDLEGAPGDGY
jgi:hypothetical protein